MNQTTSPAPDRRGPRYTRTAIFLHWVMGIALLLMLASGFALAFDQIPDTLKPTAYHWHKSSGVILLFAGFFRLLWRVLHTPPVLAGFTRMEIRLSKAGHYALYFCMLAMPLSGWAMSSTRTGAKGIAVFDWFTLPALPFLDGQAAWGSAARAAHGYIAYAFVAVIALHIAAAFKHEWLDKRPLLYRLWPQGISPR